MSGKIKNFCMFVELMELNIDNTLRKELKWYDELNSVSDDVMMLCVLLEIVQDFQCTMSLSSSAAPLDDETIAYIIHYVWLNLMI